MAETDRGICDACGVEACAAAAGKITLVSIFLSEKLCIKKECLLTQLSIGAVAGEDGGHSRRLVSCYNPNNR